MRRPLCRSGHGNRCLIARIRVTALVENTAAHGLLGEYGLAFWIETPAGAALLDTGQGEVLLRNARSLGVDLSLAKAIILSHGHYDHTGGVAEAATAAGQATICFHPSTVEPKFTRGPAGAVRAIGMPDSGRQAIEQNRRRVIYADKPTEIVGGLYVTGPIPRVTDFEDTGGEFFLDPSCSVRDPLTDDQAVYFDTVEGVVVLLGCAHSGLINSLRYVHQLTGHRPVHAVLGGMHLLSASQARLDATVAVLRQMDVHRIGLAHCTGFAAMARLHNEFPGRCFHCVTGTSLDFDCPSPTVGPGTAPHSGDATGES